MRVLQVASQGASLFVTAITQASLAAARLFAIMLEASNLCQHLKAQSQALICKIFIQYSILIYSDFRLVYIENLIYFFSSTLHSFFSAKKSYMMWAPNL
jgi:hypothetical protein